MAAEAAIHDFAGGRARWQPPEDVDAPAEPAHDDVTVGGGPEPSYSLK